jgi:hypothetical protein
MMYVCAESVKVDSDEGRITLEVEDVNGERVSVDIHGIDLDAFYDQVKARIGPYLAEMHEARQAVASGVTLAEFIADENAHERMTGQHDDSGYELSDPKHPDFHSVHADIWDARDGK